MPLTDLERTIVAIEKLHWSAPGFKESAIRERTGLRPTAYYQRLNAMLDDPRVEAAEPVLVHRLQRVRRRRVA